MNDPAIVKWKENKTQEIKVLTAKAMEPQLEEIIRKHKKEKGKLEQKIDRIEIEVTQKLVKEFDTKVKLIVKEMEKEKLEAVQQERMLWRFWVEKHGLDCSDPNDQPSPEVAQVPDDVLIV